MHVLKVPWQQSFCLRTGNSKSIANTQSESCLISSVGIWLAPAFRKTVSKKETGGSEVKKTNQQFTPFHHKLAVLDALKVRNSMPGYNPYHTFDNKGMIFTLPNCSKPKFRTHQFVCLQTRIYRVNTGTSNNIASLRKCFSFQNRFLKDPLKASRDIHLPV